MIQILHMMKLVIKYAYTRQNHLHVGVINFHVHTKFVGLPKLLILQNCNLVRAFRVVTTIKSIYYLL